MPHIQGYPGGQARPISLKKQAMEKANPFSSSGNLLAHRTVQRSGVYAQKSRLVHFIRLRLYNKNILLYAGLNRSTNRNTSGFLVSFQSSVGFMFLLVAAPVKADEED